MQAPVHCDEAICLIDEVLGNDHVNRDASLSPTVPDATDGASYPECACWSDDGAIGRKGWYY